MFTVQAHRGVYTSCPALIEQYQEMAAEGSAVSIQEQPCTQLCHDAACADAPCEKGACAEANCASKGCAEEGCAPGNCANGACTGDACNNADCAATQCGKVAESVNENTNE